MADFSSTFSRQVAAALQERSLETPASLPLPEIYSLLCHDDPDLDESSFRRLAKANLPLSDRFVDGVILTSDAELAVAVFLRRPMELLDEPNCDKLGQFLGTFRAETAISDPPPPLPQIDDFDLDDGAHDDLEEVWAAESDNDDFVYEDGNADAATTTDSAATTTDSAFTVPTPPFPPHSLDDRLAALLSLFSASLISSLTARHWDQLTVSTMLTGMATHLMTTCDATPATPATSYLRYIFALRDRTLTHPSCLPPLLTFLSTVAPEQVWILIVASLCESGELRRDESSVRELRKFLKLHEKKVVDSVARLNEGNVNEDERDCVVKIVAFYVEKGEQLTQSGLLREISMLCIKAMAALPSSSSSLRVVRMLGMILAKGGAEGVYISKVLSANPAWDGVARWMGENKCDAVFWGVAGSSLGVDKWGEVAERGAELWREGEALGVEVGVGNVSEFLQYLDGVLYVLECMRGGDWWKAGTGEGLVKQMKGLGERMKEIRVVVVEEGAVTGADARVTKGDIEKGKAVDVLMAKKLECERVKIKLAVVRRRLKETPLVAGEVNSKTD